MTWVVFYSETLQQICEATTIFVDLFGWNKQCFSTFIHPVVLFLMLYNWAVSLKKEQNIIWPWLCHRLCNLVFIGCLVCIDWACICCRTRGQLETVVEQRNKCTYNEMSTFYATLMESRIDGLQVYKRCVDHFINASSYWMSARDEPTDIYFSTL